MNPCRLTFLSLLLLGLHKSFGFQETSLEEDKEFKHRSFFRKSQVLNDFDSNAAHYKGKRLDQETSLCAIENEKSLACNSKKGKDECCPGLVCHHFQYWRCVDEENIHCSGPNTLAQECGAWKNSSPFCCEGLVCDGSFCRVRPTDVPTDTPTDAPTYAPTDTPTDCEGTWTEMGEGICRNAENNRITRFGIPTNSLQECKDGCLGAAGDELRGINWSPLAFGVTSYCTCNVDSDFEPSDPDFPHDIAVFSDGPVTQVLEYANWFCHKYEPNLAC